jgi:hypothetical protein
MKRKKKSVQTSEVMEGCFIISPTHINKERLYHHCLSTLP